MRARIQRWGNSLAVRIPRAFATETGLQQNADVEISLTGRGLLIEPATVPPRFALAELLESITDTNLHTEIETGPATGVEVW